MATTTVHITNPQSPKHVEVTYHAGLTTRSQLATVATATLTLFVLGQLLLRWIVL